MKKIYTKILSISFIILIGMSILMWMQFKNFELFKDTTSVSIKIKHLDEVLTMSARMAAFTGDLKWIERYDANVVHLDKVLSDAKKDKEILNYINLIDDANQRLIEIETKAFEFVKQNRLEDAQELLSNTTYEKYKNDYSKGLSNIVSHLNSKNSQNTNELSINYQNSLFLITLLLIIAALFGIYIINILQNYNDKLLGMTTKLDALANTDQLTTLFNRRYCESIIQHEIKYFKRYRQSFSLIMLDIDYFKQINDNYGHDAGDSVLKEFSSIMISSSREVDICSRWGGEEFIIVAPNTKLNEAVNFAEKIRKKVETTKFEIDRKVTASFGVIEYSEDMTYKDLLYNVDTALYKAKDSGRNKVMAFV